MLLTKSVLITLPQRDRKIKYFRNLGYDIPRVYNEERKIYQNQKETKLEIKVEDIPPTCRTIFVEWICDYCLEEGKYEIHRSNWNDYGNNKREIVEKDACVKHGIAKGIEIKKINLGRNFTKEFI